MTQQYDPQHWPQLSFLDVLRPPVGYQATDVILSTYSLDLVVLVSALLALTDNDTPEGSGSKIGLASALDHFRNQDSGEPKPNRLAVLVQRGRLVVPQSNSMVLTLLDRFVQEVQRDQRKRSWHTKAALVRFKGGDGDDVEWRLWIGSRNLTRDMSWDTGLVLSGMVDGEGAGVEGIQDVARALLEETGWEPDHSADLLDELARVGWQTPPDLQVNRLFWLDGSTAWRPEFREKADEIVVVTPFLGFNELNGIKASARQGARCSLLTTRIELDRALGGNPQGAAGWGLICLGASDQAEAALIEVDEEDDFQASPDGARLEDDEEIPMGLHAKIIASRYREKVQMFLGSANVTKRAWGQNNELVVELEGGLSLWNGITALVDEGEECGECLGKQELPEEESLREHLGSIRNALNNLELKQYVLDGNTVDLTADQPIDSLLEPKERELWERLQVRLEVVPMGLADNGLVEWPQDRKSIRLGDGDSGGMGDSEILRFRLSCGAGTEADPVSIGWLQRVPMDPAPDSDRDRRILASYLSPRQFLIWLKGLLDGFDGGSEPWDSDGRGAASVATNQQGGWKSRDVPSLEAMLKAWLRDPESLGQLSDIVHRYVDTEVIRRKYIETDDAEWVDALEDFRKQLDEMKSVLH